LTATSQASAMLTGGLAKRIWIGSAALNSNQARNRGANKASPTANS
jgi:hypothetical protein